MTSLRKHADGERVACEVCLKKIARSEAIVPEGRDIVAYFCGLDCFDEWRKKRDLPEERAARGRRVGPVAPQPEPELQLGTPRSRARDDRIKQQLRQHPQRDEPLIDSVESRELPPR